MQHVFGIVWAARGGGDDPVAIAVFVLILAVVMAFALIRQATARYDVVTRNGLPYCPRCNRQISYRREHCRACGYRFVSYGPSPAERARQNSLREEEVLRQRQVDAEWRAERQRRREERQRRREERRAEREAYYRERGVEPGPGARFKILPEWVQAVLLGLAISAPVLIGAVAFAMTR